MFQPGFLGTKAPLFMDVTTIIVAILPLLIAITIVVAKKGNIKLHATLQTLIYPGLFNRSLQSSANALQ